MLREPRTTTPDSAEAANVTEVKATVYKAHIRVAELILKTGFALKSIHQ